jgi:superfamily I DNA/RNA helicase
MAALFPVIPIDDEGQAPPGSLRYATPHRIKGLEADVVLLIDVTAASASSASANLYVAASRARHRLVVVGDIEATMPAP